MADDEYEGWHDRISEEIDPSKGVKSELKRIFRGSDNEPTRGQIEITRDYIAEDTDAEKAKLESKGKTYVKTGDNKFRSVKENEDVIYNPKTGKLYLTDEKGRIIGEA